MNRARAGHRYAQEVAAPMTEDIGARLYVALGRITRSVRRAAPPTPLGHGGFSALSTLLAEGPIRPGRLAELEGISAPSTTRVLATLESAGLVERTTDPADRRAHLVTATDNGRSMLDSRRGNRLQVLHDRVRELSPADQATLAAALPVLESLASVDPDAGTR
ncbi:MarR family winged helix-turn-helix transcriptional regulator [Austwickia sp. TVS 96-490-7B]|uniref:MarR family winged helix-turn-helix transcriptional regulator n=1 Tax=Austwickia sp. TVS 96-490-7B TaxID=2830843 RepID=UPI001C59622B|nr:MarR family transcriptional regulator [Austwickia sp. TVS 96-490-7B]